MEKYTVSSSFINLNFLSNLRLKVLKILKKEKPKIVIDASITGLENLNDILSTLKSEGSKIVLTDITVSELNMLQRYSGKEGFDARTILGMAAENPDFFLSVRIEHSGSNDDSIIKYCYNTKSILYTSDKEMAIKARSYEIDTYYFKQPETITKNKLVNSKVETLFAAKKIGDKLILSNSFSPVRSILLRSNGIEYLNGIRELKIGDDVYIATRKYDEQTEQNYQTFAHYKLISLNDKNNCELIYSTRIYDRDEISNMPSGNYRAFMKEFNQNNIF